MKIMTYLKKSIFKYAKLGADAIKLVVKMFELEDQIDEAKMSTKWLTVSTHLEKYKNITFLDKIGDESSQIKTSENNSKVNKPQCYYWVCLAEYQINYKYDINNAIYCIRKAKLVDSNSIDARIILCRILLFGTQSLTQKHFGLTPANSVFDKKCKSKMNNDESHTINATVEYLASNDIYLSVDVAAILGVSFQKVFKEHERSKLLSIFELNDSVAKLTLMKVLGTLAIEEATQLCQSLLIEIDQYGLNEQSAVVHLILMICLSLLDAVHLDDTTNTKFSNYKLWLHLDAISTRGVIHEVLGNHERAKEDCSYICDKMLPNLRQNPLTLAEFHSIPKVCRTQILMAISRIPLIDINFNLNDAAIQSFRTCISMESPLKDIIPIPLLIGLTVEAAVLHLRRARVEYVSNSSLQNTRMNPEGSNGFLDEINQAYSLLMSVRHILSTKLSSPAEAIQAPKLLLDDSNLSDTTPLSLLLYLPKVSSDPRDVVECSSCCLIAILMAAITTFKCYELEEYYREKDIVALLEWGQTYEIYSDVDLEWNLACIYAKVGELDKALALLSQSFDYMMNVDQINKQRNYQSRVDFPTDPLVELGSTKNPSRIECHSIHLGTTTSIAYKDLPSVLQWLGLDLKVSKHPWLIPMKYSEIILNYKTFEIPQAFSILHRSIFLLYSEVGKEILNAVGAHKDEIEISKLKKNRFMLLPENGLGDRYVLTDNDFYPRETMYSPQHIDEGLFKLLSILGRCHVVWASLNTTSDYDRFQHNQIAVKIFAWLLGGSNDPTEFEQFVEHFIYPAEDVSFLYATALAELKEYDTSIQVIESNIALELQKLGNINSSSDLDVNSKCNIQRNLGMFRHLQVLLYVTVNDDPMKIGNGIALCKKLIDDTTTSFISNNLFFANPVWNIKLTLLTLEFVAAASNDTITQIDGNIVSMMDSILDEIIQSFETIHVGSKSTPTSVGKGANRSIPPTISAIRSMTIGKDGSMVSIASKAKDSSNRGNLYSPFKSSPLVWNTIVEGDKCLATSVLIGISRLYRRVGRFQHCRIALEEAWRILYFIDKSVEDKLRDISAGQASEHQAIDTLRLVPTLLGWRLPDGCGWGAAHFYRDIEADILCECGLLIQEEEKLICSSRAIELFQLAISTYTVHARSFIELANIETKKFEILLHRDMKYNYVPGIRLDAFDINAHLGFQMSKIKDGGVVDISLNNEKQSFSEKPPRDVRKENRQFELIQESQELASAYSNVTTALLSSDLKPDAWLAFGKVLELMGNKSAAMEAYMTSIECQHQVPVRTFTSVLLG